LVGLATVPIQGYPDEETIQLAGIALGAYHVARKRRPLPLEDIAALARRMVPEATFVP
jgi:hypothetical protein